MSKIQVWVRRRKLKKGNGYSVQWVDPRTGKVKTEACGSDKTYARQKAADRRRELMDGSYRGITTISYDEYATEHLATISGTLAEATCVEHELALRQFKDACNPKSLTVIDFAMLEKFRNARLADKVKPATINKALRTLQSALGFAVERNYLKANPFKGKRKKLWVREPEPDVVTMEADEFRQILDACPDAHWRGICLVGYYGGLRRGEIVALQWRDVDFEGEILHVRNKSDHSTKSGKIRQVPMDTHIIEALEALRSGMFRSEHVFRNASGGQFRRGIAKRFTAIVIKAGLFDEVEIDGKIKKKARYSMHDFRRTCATELLLSGVDPKSVQAILGHASLATTMKYYAAVNAQNLKAAIKKREARTA